MFNKYPFLDQASDGTDGAGGGATGASAPPADTVLDQGKTVDNQWMPEKYQVKKPDGTLDMEASSRKVTDAHTALEKRLGSTEPPPKTAEEYAPNLEIEGFNWDEFKADPEMQGFLKGAHSKGITNDQLSFVLGEYINKAGALMGGSADLDVENATKELQQSWKTTQEFDANVQSAFKAFDAFADPADRDKVDAIGNNPIIVRLLANIGKEMKEDKPIHEGTASAQTWEEEVGKIRANPAYTDKNHAEHKGLVTKMETLYQKRYGTKQQILGGGRNIET